MPSYDHRYAREDTHYLLYIYDLMRIKLYAMPKEAENIDAPLVEVIPPAPLPSSTDFMGLWVFFPFSDFYTAFMWYCVL